MKAEYTKRLSQLAVDNRVHIHNQTGPHPLKWVRTGTVIEVQQLDQYRIRVDGTGRVTLRNWKFLRRYVPVDINMRLKPHLLEEDLFRKLSARSSLTCSDGSPVPMLDTPAPGMEPATPSPTHP